MYIYNQAKAFNFTQCKEKVKLNVPTDWVPRSKGALCTKFYCNNTILFGHYIKIREREEKRKSEREKE
jgi:hypothetical protein